MEKLSFSELKTGLGLLAGKYGNHKTVRFCSIFIFLKNCSRGSQGSDICFLMK